MKKTYKLHPLPLRLTVHTSFDELCDHAASRGWSYTPEHDCSLQAVVYMDRNMGDFAVLLDEGWAANEIEKHCTIAHESLHVATHAWDWVGAGLHSAGNDEVLAYTMEYVMRCIYDSLKEETSNGH